MKTNSNDDKTDFMNNEGNGNEGRSEKIIRFKNLNPRQRELLKNTALGLGGVATGAAIITVMGMVIPEDTMDSNSVEALDIPVFTNAPFSDAVNDNMSFSEAFAAARGDVGGGGGFFDWHGQTYNTYIKEEWDSMSDDKRNEFFNSIDPDHSPADLTDEQEILSILNDDISDIEVIADIDDEDIIITDEHDRYMDIDIDDPDIVIIDDDPDIVLSESPDFDDNLSVENEFITGIDNTDFEPEDPDIFSDDFEPYDENFDISDDDFDPFDDDLLLSDDDVNI